MDDLPWDPRWAHRAKKALTRAMQNNFDAGASRKVFERHRFNGRLRFVSKTAPELDDPVVRNVDPVVPVAVRATNSNVIAQACSHSRDCNDRVPHVDALERRDGKSRLSTSKNSDRPTTSRGWAAGAQRQRASPVSSYFRVQPVKGEHKVAAELWCRRRWCRRPDVTGLQPCIGG